MNSIIFSQYYSSANPIEAENLAAAIVLNSISELPVNFEEFIFVVPVADNNGKKMELPLIAENYYKIYIDFNVPFNCSSLYFAIHCPEQF